MLMENIAPLSPPCPTCGKEMRLMGHSPTCEGVIYEFWCSDDGDRLSWRTRCAAANSRQNPLTASASSLNQQGGSPARH